ncbi:hypothetical protein Pth03_33530 [Planotetraspora thailandica]|uniref:Uncharacterized protein n=1 Tax=Planotetraspora thailandica TaxID=487172 RepID=A0A8J3XW24_9ACTN|nr:hypothetical protein Pth03_33530 [Planotetraspora thailandica]
MLEGQVNDAVGRGGAAAKAVEVVEGAAVHLGAGGRQRGGRPIRAGQADDLVPGFEEFEDDGGPDVPGRASDEYAHYAIPLK